MLVLPEALRPLASYRQFIIWKLVPSTTRPGKADKIPVHPQTGVPHNPHDPAVWMDADAAIAQAATVDDYGVGFVFTADDPFFFLDIDNCLQPNGKWSEIALDLCSRFNGAAVEVSQSGTGLHIFGSYADTPTHSCRHDALGLEFYTSGRFVALTGVNAIGSAAAQNPDALTYLVATYFPPSATVELTDWTSEPCGEWNGIADDDALVEKMLSSKGAGSIFGGRASIQALWTADEEILAAAYPDSGSRSFDHSSADAALAQHLAFWTGKDCERIDRLFRQSALFRDKWDVRADYRQRTILHAVGYCRAVYGQGTAEAVTDGLGIEDAEMRLGYQLLAVSQQMELFKGCVYVRDLHRIFTPDGSMLKAEQFRATYGGYTFVMDTIRDKVSKNAWEAFTESQAVRFPKAHGVCFRPEEPSGAIIEEEGRTLLNIYIPIETPCTSGDASPFLNHAAKVLPVERDRDILLAYMAACVQHKGIKFQWCPLIQGTVGNGKTLFITALAHAIGNRYTHLPNASDLGGNGQKFNAWIQGNLFIGVEEIYTSDRREVSEALKPLITNSRIEIQGKGLDQVTGDNRANFLMCSNHKGAVSVTIDNRRYCVMYSAQQSKADKLRDGMGGRYFPELYKWLRSGGYAIITDFLYSYQIPEELNPANLCHEAPETSSTLEAIDISRGRVEQEVLEAIDEDRPGFAGGWVSSKALDQLLEDRRDSKIIPPNKRRELLQSLGYDLHPGLADGRVNSIIPFENGKPRLYIKKGHISTNAEQPCQITRLYMVAQGYVKNEQNAGAEVFSRG